jgi:hypothetical protein
LLRDLLPRLKLSRAAAVAGVLSLLLVFLNAVHISIEFVKELRKQNASERNLDIQSYFEAHPKDRISVGVGHSFDKSFARLNSVWRGAPYWFDPAAMIDMNEANLALPEASIELLRSCAINTWLIPHGENPFSFKSYYDDTSMPSTERISQEFQAVYELQDQTKFYDIWNCRKK